MSNELIRRLRQSDPTTPDQVTHALHDDDWSTQALASVVASNASPSTAELRESRRRRSGRAVAWTVAAAMLATGGVLVALTLVSPSDDGQEAVTSPPPPRLTQLAPLAGSVHQVMAASTPYGRWSLWTLITQNNRTAIFDSLEPADGAHASSQLDISACPSNETTPASGEQSIDICLVTTDVPVVNGTVVAGRVNPRVSSVEALFRDGSTVTGYVSNEFFILPLPGVNARFPSTLPIALIGRDRSSMVVGNTITGGSNSGQWLSR